eukprot:TRINITY_DN3887_c0_g1_i1.p1 TRINITY_DN3887_c0_g1~~TRINITY_DN3887_c0_g1_i1.p1  ORF type:complete len:465 (-),score=94.50 TRINITY_DN3887_c0_g1_i1:87-1481(-)
MTSRLQDRHGFTVATRSSQCMRYLEESELMILKYDAKLEGTIQKAIQEDQTCVLAYCMASSVAFLKNELQKSRVMLDRALVLSRQIELSDREKEYLKVLSSLVVNEDWWSGMREALEMVKKYPSYLFFAKFSSILAFYLGKHDIMIQIPKLIQQTDKENHFVYGMLAFALLEDRQYELARKTCEKGFSLTHGEVDPWLEHAMAHILYQSGELHQGLSFMQSVKHHWKDCNSFMYSHNWWHLALFLLDTNSPVQQIFQIFDEHIWTKDKSFCQDQINAASFLLRLELHQVQNYLSRLEDLGKHVGCPSSWHQDLQNDLLICWVLLRLRAPNAPQFIPSAESHVQKMKDTDRQHILQTVYIPCLKGIQAYVDHNWEEARKLLEGSCMRVGELGASVDQMSVFVEIYLDVLEKCEQYGKIVEIVENHFFPRFTKMTYWLEKMKLYQTKLNRVEKIQQIDELLTSLTG